MTIYSLKRETKSGTFKRTGIPILPHGFRGIWGDPWFADFDHGNDGNVGDRPDRALKYIDTALGSRFCRSDDVIYVRARAADGSGGDPQKITMGTSANAVVRQGCEGLSIVGTHPGSLAAAGTPGHMAHRIYVAGHASAAATVPILEIRAPYTTIENLAWAQANGSTTITNNGSIYVHGGVGGSYEAFGTVIANCMFRFAEGDDGTAAIYNLDSWYMDVMHCYFYRCEVGIGMRGLNSSCRGLNATNCTFQGLTTERACDIQVYGGSSTYINVHGCHFGAACTDTGPTGAGDYIYLTSATAVSIQGCYFDVADAAAELTADGDAVDGPNYDGGGFVA
uniref:Uncharacterized protein n=1 Tax=viral metagenome TaxID=1070528 RepID=A0A6M3JHS2_9ZZZZ